MKYTSRGVGKYTDSESDSDENTNNVNPGVAIPSTVPFLLYRHYFHYNDCLTLVGPINLLRFKLTTNYLHIYLPYSNVIYIALF